MAGLCLTEEKRRRGNSQPSFQPRLILVCRERKGGTGHESGAYYESQRGGESVARWGGQHSGGKGGRWGNLKRKKNIS